LTRTAITSFNAMGTPSSGLSENEEPARKAASAASAWASAFVGVAADERFHPAVHSGDAVQARLGASRAETLAGAEFGRKIGERE
jgi:hypothetical protein